MSRCWQRSARRLPATALDNWILDLAAAAGAFLVVSADVDLTGMSPWQGRPIIEPPQFASMVDASRWACRRRK